MYADFMGFLLTQEELMTRDPNARFADTDLDLCHVTVAPPFARTMAAITENFDYLRGIAEKEGAGFLTNRSDLDYIGLGLVGGLQCPPIDATEADLMKLRQAGVIFMTLAYADEEPIFGGGFALPEIGLTERGEVLLEQMASVGMVLDLSHASVRTARDAMEYINRRGFFLSVVASHTGCATVYDYNRNLPDDVLRQIAAYGGLIGISTLTFMLHETDNSLGPFCEHLRHALRQFGTFRVAVGSDGIYRELDLARREQIFSLMKEKIDPRGIFRARFPDQPDALNSPSRMSILCNLMSREPYCVHSAILERVLGENLFDFLAEVL